jgi:hypothetical protein
VDAEAVGAIEFSSGWSLVVPARLGMGLSLHSNVRK